MEEYCTCRREGEERKEEEAHLSRVPANIYFPFGENFTKDTGGFSSSEGMSGL